MRLLFVVDARSPIALNWIRHFIQIGEEVHLVSTFDFAPEPGVASCRVIPVAFSSLKKSSSYISVSAGVPRIAPGLRTQLRQWLGPLTLKRAAGRLRQVIDEVQPDLVHAMRIPFEGMLAGIAMEPSASLTARRRQHIAPLLMSIWGNDFTLHAPSTPFMRSSTRHAMGQADALHADCHRDVRLAHDWGFDPAKPAIVLPGGGGIQITLFYPPQEPVSAPVVINPRGFRSYVNNQAFFHAIPHVLDKIPGARFLCPTMENEPQAQRWVRELGIDSQVELLPVQTRPQMAELFRQTRLAVSPSTHDGTPNTLLEAMACGTLPVAGDLESVREWITDGKNGLLVDPNNPQALAVAILRGLEDDSLQRVARRINLGLIAERAEHTSVMRQAGDFYLSLFDKKNQVTA